MKEELKERLIKHLRFLEEELIDFILFKTLTWETYRTDRSKRRDVERWIENLVNSSIDIAKIILNKETIILPETYREIVASLSLVENFENATIEPLSKWVRLRNIITHEYLDIRWVSIKKFIEESEPIYRTFIERLKEYLKRQMQPSDDRRL